MAQKETNIFPEVKVINKKNKMPALLFTVLIVALVAVSGAATYFYFQNIQLKKNPQVLAQQEVKQLVDKVSHLIVLPEGETPTIATVTNPSLLKDQPFFAKAQKGDKVLIYTNAKKAILYNPTTNKIVDVAPINIGNTPATTPSSTSTTTPTTKP